VYDTDMSYANKQNQTAIPQK